MTSPPLVSVMMVVFNGGPYLREAIDSVLAQSYEPVELIVVDDGSDDGSGQVAQSYLPRLRYVFQDRAGIGAARNRAVELATGEYLTFLDADDRFVPDALARQVDVLQSDPELDMVFAHVTEFVSPDLDEVERANLRTPASRIPGRLPTTMLCRREAFLRVGGFATDIRMGVTLDWSARAIEQGLRSLMLPDVLFERRLHAQNNGLRERDSRTHYVRVLKASLDRRRAMAAGSEGDAGGDASPAS